MKIRKSIAGDKHIIKVVNEALDRYRQLKEEGKLETIYEEWPSGRFYLRNR